MRLNNRVQMCVLTSVVAGLCSAAALGQGVGNLGQLPVIVPLGPNGWEVGTAANPQPVVRDPNGPAWIKQLGDANGGPIVAPPFFSSQLHETVIVSGNLPWRDWHEQVQVPGWSWAPVFITVNGAPPSNLSIVNTPGTPAAGGTIDYFFDPVAPGSVVEILKRLVYDNGVPGTVFTGHVPVAQYPTPEPASLLMLGIGGLLITRSRRAA